MSFLLIGILIISGAACRSSSEDAGTPAGLAVVTAPKTGTIKRILVREDMDIAENSVLIEIAVPSNTTSQFANSNRSPVDSPAQNQGKAIAEAEQKLQQAAVELQRIEPLVTSGGAPPAHLDAARAEYQQAQERLDQLRRRSQNPQPNSPLQQNNKNPAQNAPPENIIAVRAPVAGNVRVISARIGQSVKAGEPVATISTTR